MNTSFFSLPDLVLHLQTRHMCLYMATNQADPRASGRGAAKIAAKRMPAELHARAERDACALQLEEALRVIWLLRARMGAASLALLLVRCSQRSRRRSISI